MRQDRAVHGGRLSSPSEIKQISNYFLFMENVLIVLPLTSYKKHFH